MSAAPSFGQLTAGDAKIEAPGPDTPFRIAVLADLGGRDRPDDLTRRKPRPLDPEDFDTAVAAVRPAVTLDGLDGGDVELSFSSLDDFHPDALYSAADRFPDLDGREERTAYMKAILRHPKFQALESAWRGADWLLRRARKPGSKVEVILYDVTRDEFVAALNASDDLAESPLYKLLIEQATQGPKGKPWALFVGDYLFGVTAADAQALGRMAKIAREAAAPFLATAAPAVLDKAFAPSEDDAAAWEAMRRLPEANVLGLVTPRFLLRQPYGENTRAIERFDFEEFSGPDDRVGYLWGGAAWATAALLAQAFLKESWGFKPGGSGDLGDMPLHTWRDEDDDEQLTLAEAWLDRKAAERLGALGLVPLLGVKGRDAVQVLRFTALALPEQGKPAPGLLGRWGQKGFVVLPSGLPGLSTKVGLAGAPKAPPPPSSAYEETPAEDAPAAEAPAAADDAVEGMDPELAALLGEMGGDTPAAEEPAAEMDPELAALLGDLGGDEASPAAEAPAAEEPAADIDPELAALLGDLGADEASPAAETPAAETPAEVPAAEAPADEMDADLAALLAQMESGEGEAAEPEPPAEEMDPDLAALLKDMEG